MSVRNEFGSQIISMEVDGYERVQRKLNSIHASMQKIHRTNQQMGSLGGGLSKGSFGSGAMGFGQSAMMGMGRGLGMLGAGGAAVGLGVMAGRAVGTMASFEQEIANIRKTTGLAGVNLDRMSKGILDLSSAMRVSRPDLSRIAEIAGQIGISDVDENLKFTKSTAMMAATSDMSPEQAAEGAAQALKVFQKTTNEVDNLNGMLTALAAQSTATEGQLLDMMLRAGGTAELLGLTAQEVAGISATLRDTGVHVEVAGTAMSQIFGLLLTNLEDVADMLKMDKYELQALVATKPYEAFMKLNEELAKMNQFQRAEAIHNLGLEGERAFVVAAKLTSHLGDLKENIAIANDEFTKGTAHIKEYAAGTDTLSRSIVQLKNTWDKAMITGGDLGFLRKNVDLATELLGGEKNPNTIRGKNPTPGFFAMLAAGVGLNNDPQQILPAAQEVADKQRDANRVKIAEYERNRIANDDAMWSKADFDPNSAAAQLVNSVSGLIERAGSSIAPLVAESFRRAAGEAELRKHEADRMEKLDKLWGAADTDNPEFVVKQKQMERDRVLDLAQRLRAAKAADGDNWEVLPNGGHRMVTKGKKAGKGFDPEVFGSPQDLDMAIQKAMLTQTKPRKTDEEYLKELVEQGPKADDVKAITEFMKSGRLHVTTSGNVIRIE